MPIDATQPYDADNIFAKILRGEIPCKQVYRDEWSLAFHDINPQAPTHVLVVPRVHQPDIASLAAADPAVTAELLTQTRVVAEAEGYESYQLAFNTGAEAGQTVFHAHGHVLAGSRVFGL